MSKLSHIVASIALVAMIATLPSAAQARGKGGPASAHRGCMTNNGIPLDDGQSVVVDGVTITCNNGSVCHFSKGRFPYCYVNVQAASAKSRSKDGNTGQRPSSKRPPTRKGVAAASR